MLKIGYNKNAGVYVNNIKDNGPFILTETDHGDTEYDSFKEFIDTENEFGIISKFKAMNTIKDIIGFPENTTISKEVYCDYFEAYLSLHQKSNDLKSEISKYDKFSLEWRARIDKIVNKSYLLVEWTEDDTTTGNTCDIDSFNSYETALSYFTKRREELEDMGNFNIENETNDKVTYTYDCNGGLATLHLEIVVKDIISL